jgi:hypothetical protein
VPLKTIASKSLAPGPSSMHHRLLEHQDSLTAADLIEHAAARDLDAVSDAVVDRGRASLQDRIGSARTGLSEVPEDGPGKLTERELRRELIAAETAEPGRLFDDGTISSPARHVLQRNLDLELARLTKGPM